MPLVRMQSSRCSIEWMNDAAARYDVPIIGTNDFLIELCQSVFQFDWKSFWLRVTFIVANFKAEFKVKFIQHHFFGGWRSIFYKRKITCRIIDMYDNINFLKLCNWPPLTLIFPPNGHILWKWNVSISQMRFNAIVADPQISTERIICSLYYINRFN